LANLLGEGGPRPFDLDFSHAAPDVDAVVESELEAFGEGVILALALALVLGEQGGHLLHVAHARLRVREPALISITANSSRSPHVVQALRRVSPGGHAVLCVDWNPHTGQWSSGIASAVRRPGRCSWTSTKRAMGVCADS